MTDAAGSEAGRPEQGLVAGTMDQVRPMTLSRALPLRFLDWSPVPYPTLSGGGPAPTQDRRETPGDKIKAQRD